MFAHQLQVHLRLHQPRVHLRRMIFKRRLYTRFLYSLSSMNAIPNIVLYQKSEAGAHLPSSPPLFLGNRHSSDCVTAISRNGELRTRKLKTHLLRTQSLKVFPLKPGVGPYIAIHATLTARDFFLANFYLSGPFTCIFPKPLPIFSCVGCGYHQFLCRPA